MKVLYVITKSKGGGAQRYVRDLAISLPGDKFETKILAGGKGFPILQESSGILPVLFSFLNLKALFKLRAIFRKEKPEVIHLNSSKILGLGGIAALGLGAKVIATVHGWPFLEPRSFLVKSLIWSLSWLSSLFHDKIILISKRDFEIAQKFIPARKLVYIPNGIGPIDFLPRNQSRSFFSEKIRRKIPTSSVIIGTIAELTKNKGLNYLIDAAAKIKATTLIIGEGEDRPKLELRIRNQGLADKVFLLGLVSDAAKYLKGLDIFVLPSLKEGLPYTILEAQAAGVPIVATCVGGLPDLLENNLVRPEDPRALAAAINSVLSRPIPSRISKENSLENMVKKTIELYV